MRDPQVDPTPMEVRADVDALIAQRHAGEIDADEFEGRLDALGLSQDEIDDITPEAR